MSEPVIPALCNPATVESVPADCPFLPGAHRRIHWSFPDPAAVEGDEAKLQAFRDVRDGLITRFKRFVQEEA